METKLKEIQAVVSNYEKEGIEYNRERIQITTRGKRIWKQTSMSVNIETLLDQDKKTQPLKKNVTNCLRDKESRKK